MLFFVGYGALDACAYKCIWQDSSVYIPESVPNCRCPPQIICNHDTDCIYYPYTECDRHRFHCVPASSELQMLAGVQNRSLLLEAVFMNILANNHSKCPTKQGFLSALNCPCDTKTLLCPNGTYCGSNSICLACPPGNLCIHPKTNPKLCPFGYFCPNATHKIPCPQGHFCPQGVYEPVQCMPGIQYMELPTPPSTIGEKFSTQPLYGTFCPAQLKGAPFPVCQAGFYCPTPNQSLPCPEGHYCKPQSLRPIPCPLLTSCPAQTYAPKYSSIIILFIMCIITLVFLTHIETFRSFYKYIKKTLLKSKRQFDESHFSIHENSLSAVYLETSRDIACSPNKAIVFDKVSVRDPTTSQFWLQPTTGYFVYNGLNAVMGSSGCGKSTLLEVLRGRMYSGKIQGTVSIPRQEINMDLSEPHNLTKYRTNFAFVPQDDVLYGNLTVKENVILSAMLKTKIPPTNVCDLLDSLGLDSTVQNKLVGTIMTRGISGGQRKRTSIAMEIITKKPIVILDEPTSGLDSTGSYKVLSVLKHIPDTTVITILHQPRFNSFMLFDHLLLLSKSGMVFMGSPNLSIIYFQYGLKYNLDPDDNPADAIMDIVSKKHSILAPHWNDKGFTWAQDLQTSFPNLDYMKAQHKPVNTIPATPKDLINLFHTNHVTNFTLTDANHIINNIPNINAYLQTISYPDTLVAQADLFKHTSIKPIPLLQDLSGGTITLEVYPYVKRFCDIMMKKYTTPRPHLKSRLQTQGIKQKLIMLMMVLNSSQGRHTTHQTQIQPQTSSLPNMFKQYIIIAWTSLMSQYRSLFIIQIIVTLVAGFIIGGIQGSTWTTLEFPSKISMATTCLTILSTIKHVDTFTNDALIMRRNIYNNASITSYTLALMTTDMFWIIIMPLLFLVPYYYLVFPTISFGTIYGFLLLSCMWASGLAYMITIIPYINNSPVWSNLLCVFIVIILGVFFNGLTAPTLANSQGIIRFFHGLSYNRWVTEALSVSEFNLWETSMNNRIYAFMQRIGMCIDKIKTNNTEMFILTVVKSINGTQTIKQLCGYVIRDSVLVLLGTSIAFRLLAFFIFQIKYYNLTSINSLFGINT